MTNLTKKAMADALKQLLPTPEQREYIYHKIRDEYRHTNQEGLLQMQQQPLFCPPERQRRILPRYLSGWKKDASPLGAQHDRITSLGGRTDPLRREGSLDALNQPLGRLPGAR